MSPTVSRCSSRLSESISKAAKLSDAELRTAVSVVCDVRLQVERFTDGRSIRKAICMDGYEALLALIEPQLIGMSPLALGSGRLRGSADH